MNPRNAPPRGRTANAPWIETFASVAAILFAFFVLLAMLRYANEAGVSGSAAAAAPQAAPPAAEKAPLARELVLRLGDRADLLDLFEPAAAKSLRVRLDRACDFAPGSDAIEFVAARLLADVGSLCAERGARLTVAAAEGGAERSEAAGRLAARRALAVAALLVAAGVPEGQVEARAESRAERGGAIEIGVAAAEGER